MDAGQREGIEKQLVPSSDQTPHEQWNKLLQ